MTQFELKYSLGMATGQVFSYLDLFRRPRPALPGPMGPVNPSQIWAQSTTQIMAQPRKKKMKCKETHKTPLRYFGKCKEKSKMFDLATEQNKLSTSISKKS